MRVCFYIDGFNLYHKIADLPQKSVPDKSLRWLNLYALAEKLRLSPQEELISVYYFSAFADWIAPAKQRHEIYVQALRAGGVKVKLGNFKEKSAKCPQCHYVWKKHEEKESDVNLALQAVADAYEDKYDRAYIISADSDMIPAMQMVKEKFPQKEICAVFPPNSRGTKNIKKIADYSKTITPVQIAASLFPQIIKGRAGKWIICPKEWR